MTDKIGLTIEEAADYTGIGIALLIELCRAIPIKTNKTASYAAKTVYNPISSVVNNLLNIGIAKKFIPLTMTFPIVYPMPALNTLLCFNFIYFPQLIFCLVYNY